MQFEFATASRILFGPGTLQQVAPLAAEMGSRALLVTGRTVERSAPLLDQLEACGVAATTYSIPAEPTTAGIWRGVLVARQAGCDLVIGLGGGSVLDSVKAIAALLTNPGDLLDYLEVIGRGRPLAQPSMPTILIPTTAGTGAEVTRNAVLSSPEHGIKVSLRSPSMLPRLAVVDPLLTHSMPPAVTASTGLDALTQLIEPFVSLQANPLTDALCREGIARAAWALPRAYHDGGDRQAREAMSLASLLGGLALANAKLGAVHGFAATLGGMLGAPHGALCARLLPAVMEANLRALQARNPKSFTLARYDEVARLLNANPAARAADGVAWVDSLCEALRVPPLSQYGLTESCFPAVVAQSRASSSMKGNPVALTDEELTAILQAAL